jgi:hypothetical protein
LGGLVELQEIVNGLLIQLQDEHRDT